jgi:aspartate ammonia-lyase
MRDLVVSAALRDLGNKLAKVDNDIADLDSEPRGKLDEIMTVIRDFASMVPRPGRGPL